MGKVFFWVISFCVLISVQSCCTSGSETYHYTLKPADEKFVPYQLGQQIKFRHSAGKDVVFTVSDRYKDVDEEKGGGEGIFVCSDNFIRESEKIKLISSSPQFEVLLEMFGNLGQEKSVFRIQTLNTYFPFQNPFDVCAAGGIYNCYDSVQLLNKTYYQVYEITPDSTEINQNILRAKRLMYNTQFGVLQIELSNNEKYTISQ